MKPQRTWQTGAVVGPNRAIHDRRMNDKLHIFTKSVRSKMEEILRVADSDDRSPGKG